MLHYYWNVFLIVTLINGRNSQLKCDISKAQLQSFANFRSGLQEETITRLSGAKIGDKVNSLTCGKHGPVLLEDTILIEELSHFDRERIPERVVHAKGGGAFGFFVVTHPEITKYTKASVFNHVGKKTDIFVRFSTVAGELGSADTVRDPRGFAIKFYTDEGIWDLVGNNSPLLAVRDPILFPSFVHSQKRNPKTHLRDLNALWDFLSLRPESLHQVSFVFSDRGIPDGFRFMPGFGANTFKFVNRNNEVFFCKFHYLPNQGNKNLSPEDAKRIAGEDPDYAIRDLYNAIESRNFPSWTFYVQIMTPAVAQTWHYNPFDVTKIWPEKEFPLIKVGQIVLNRNPDNHFAQVEQAAFSPANMPPGIEPSPDKVLQGRLFSYPDTQRYRLGVNHLKIPINSPRVKTITPTLRDGAFVINDNMDGAPNYFPNSYLKASTNLRFKQSRYRVSGTPDVDRFDSNEDNFSQVRMFWNEVLDEGARGRLIKNLAASLKNAQVFIQQRMVILFSKVSPDYGRRLEVALQRSNSTATSQKERCPNSKKP